MFFLDAFFVPALSLQQGWDPPSSLLPYSTAIDSPPWIGENWDASQTFAPALTKQLSSHSSLQCPGLHLGLQPKAVVRFNFKGRLRQIVLFAVL